MRKWFRIFLLASILTAFGVLLGYEWGAPRLLTVSPPDGATTLPAGSEVRLAFSRHMQSDSVIALLSIKPTRQGSFTWQGNTLIFTPTQPWEPGTLVEVKLRAGSRTADMLSFLPMREEKTWSFRIRQPSLAYLYPSNGEANIYLLNPLSGESETLTSYPQGVQDFSVNASGTVIYYSVRTEDQTGSEIYRLPLNTGASDQAKTAATDTPPPEAELILACPQAACRAPVVSPQGTYLAYERTEAPGKNQPDFPRVRVLPLPESVSGAVSTPSSALVPFLAGEVSHQTLLPHWSPSGLLTFYDTQAAAFVTLDLQNGQKTLFPNQTGQPGDWNPNGRAYVAPEIFFLDANVSKALQELSTFSTSHLLQFTWPDGRTYDLTPNEDIEDTTPAFSPDGKYLVFARKYLGSSRWTPGRQIWILNTETRQSMPLTSDAPYNHFDFAWSPGGDQLAYVRFNQTVWTELPEIWLMDPFTGRSLLLIIGGYAPIWIP